MTSPFETDRLAELIDQKHELLAQLRGLSRRQAEMIADGDMTKLLGVLAAKQQLLERLQTVQRQLDPFRNQDPDQRVWRSGAHRQRCRDVAERCEAMLREIMLVEKQCEADLVARRDQAAATLQGIHAAREARTAYTKPGDAGHGHFDVTSSS